LFVEALLCDSDVLVFFVATQGALISVCVFAASNAFGLRVKRKGSFKNHVHVNNVSRALQS
jgi:hypothetical protein